MEAEETCTLESLVELAELTHSLLCSMYLKHPDKRDLILSAIQLKLYWAKTESLL